MIHFIRFIFIHVCVCVCVKCLPFDKFLLFYVHNNNEILFYQQHIIESILFKNKFALYVINLDLGVKLFTSFSLS